MNQFDDLEMENSSLCEFSLPNYQITKLFSGSSPDVAQQVRMLTAKLASTHLSSGWWGLRNTMWCCEIIGF